MAPFDPVRDAVLNSPIAASTSSQPPFHSHYSNRSDSPTTAPTSSPFDPLASPSLGRRATDLSVLLNAEPEEPRSPVRSSSLSHLLLQSDKLPDVGSLRRISIPDTRREESYFPPQRPSSSHSQSNQIPPSTPSSSQSFVAGPSRTVTASPISRSPVISNSRPSSSSSTSRQASRSTVISRTTTSPKMPPPTPSRPPPIEYKPRHRITPADSVLRPITPEEIESYRNTYSLGGRRLKKRKREQCDEPDLSDQRPTKRLAGDVGVVIEHYNARPDVGVKQRRESPIIGLKNFNNWIKSVLISRFAHPVLATSPSSNHQFAGAERKGKGAPSGKVLDMGCGKGGDLSKWSKARIKEYMGVDIAAKSIEQAQDRWQTMRGARFDATFAALDCYTESLSKAFPPAKFVTPFDVVSMQFCMHYAFETVQKARIMLENVSRWLRPGGVFLGTIPNAEQLLERLDGLPPDTDDLAFGNSVYQIRFDEREKQPIFGHKYWFFLQDAVENVPEYIVRWRNFVEMATEYGLELKYKEEFHTIYEEHQEHKEFGPLLLRMNVVEANGESSMDEDQWEAANIYVAFAFEKRPQS